MFMLQSGEGEMADDPECQCLCYRAGRERWRMTQSVDVYVTEQGGRGG